MYERNAIQIVVLGMSVNELLQNMIIHLSVAA